MYRDNKIALVIPAYNEEKLRFWEKIIYYDYIGTKLIIWGD